MIKIARFIQSVLDAVFRIMLVIIMMMIFTPPAYFFWRASQPMVLLEFRGLTYYQFMHERRQAYVNMAQEYQANHPDQQVDYKNCFVPELTVQVVGGFPNAGFYALAGMYPDLEKNVNFKDIQKGYLPEEATWASFLTAWWETYEKLVLGMAEHSSFAPVPYCRISTH